MEDVQMTWGGRLISLFPMLYLVLIIFWFQKMFLQAQVYDFAMLLALIYLLPLGLHRIHLRFFPLPDGAWDISARKYNPWWGSHMLQLPFIAIPWLESLLHFVPGLFSLWLRAWGSQIGRGVYWTPRVEILDRGLIVVGDKVLFGHLTAMSSHMVAEIEGRPMLVIKRIHIGSKALIGADTQFGPGAVIAERTKVKPKTRLYWRGDWSE